jgi:SAM-dependent methyltransferase
MATMTIKESALALPEFEQYAHCYADYLDDPLRTRFALDPLHFHRRKWLLIQKLLNRAGVDPARSRWLDVGCGQGNLLELAGKHFSQASGCDLSAGMLASCASFPVREQASPVELPYEDSSMDFVTSVCVYHHVHGSDRTLLTSEIRRVLAPGGLYCIVEHNPWNPVTRTIVGRCAVDLDAELLAAQSAGRLLVAGGFGLLRTSYFLYLPEQLFGRFGAVESALERVPLGGQYALLARAPR